MSSGAELIADGNIHVYAPLRGRALAGAYGDRRRASSARAWRRELVAVAGLYRTSENSAGRARAAARQGPLKDEAVRSSLVK